MPLEVDYQKLICDVVKEAGGFGKKLSNRFLVGVPDLLLLHPDWTPGIYEVKLNKKPIRKDIVNLEVTVPQENFLRAIEPMNMIAAVFSILRDGNDFGVAIKTITCFDKRRIQIAVNDYIWKHYADRKAIIWHALWQFNTQERHDG